MDIKVYPGKLKGTVQVPPSKSMAHRALICASLAEGRSVVRGISESKDMEATIGCMTALGAKIRRIGDGTAVTVDGISGKNSGAVRRDGKSGEFTGTEEETEELRGEAGRGGAETVSGQCEDPVSPVSPVVLDCNESGSTFRFVLPIAAALGKDAAFEGRGKLPQRPMTPLAEEMKKNGVTFLPDGRDFLPFEICGRLRPGVYELPGNVSSQYFSGLMFALPLLKGDSEIRVKGKMESVGYIALTQQMLSDFGVRVEETEYGFRVPGNQRYQATDISVEGDYSQAAFWLAAAACGSELKITGLRSDSVQGDREAADIIERFGAEVIREYPDLIVRAPEKYGEGSGLGLKALEADSGNIPDVIPVLSVAAACAEGTSRFYNASRLRIKECDRLSAMADCLTRLGVTAEEKEDELTVTGGRRRGGCRVSGYNDHRIVMSIAVAALSCEEPVVISEAEAVQKSYPDFFDEFRRLGGRADVISDR